MLGSLSDTKAVVKVAAVGTVVVKGVDKAAMEVASKAKQICRQKKIKECTSVFCMAFDDIVNGSPELPVWIQNVLPYVGSHAAHFPNWTCYGCSPLWYGWYCKVCNLIVNWDCQVCPWGGWYGEGCEACNIGSLLRWTNSRGTRLHGHRCVEFSRYRCEPCDDLTALSRCSHTLRRSLRAFDAQ